MKLSRERLTGKNSGMGWLVATPIRGIKAANMHNSKNAATEDHKTILTADFLVAVNALKKGFVNSNICM